MKSDDETPELNWVERRERRDDNLAQGAAQVWQQARTAIHDCCNSFKQYHSDPAVTLKPENGHLLSLVLVFSDGARRDLTIAFAEDRNVIEVTENNRTPLPFFVRSDEDHTFITAANKEITADEFSEAALATALYAPRLQRHRRTRSTSQMRPGKDTQRS